MASTVTRRPLPALVALLALLLLTALVWWRVLNRSSGADTQTNPAPCTASRSPSSAAPAPKATLPAADTVTIRVLNSTDRSGIAGKAQDALVQDGFKSPKAAGNDEKHHNKIKAVAVIRYGPSTKDAAVLLHYYLPGAQMVRTKRSSSTVVISLGKKYKHVATPAHVRAAMQADSVAISGVPAQPPPSSPSC